MTAKVGTPADATGTSTRDASRPVASAGGAAFCADAAAPQEALAALRAVLAGLHADRVAIAVSGGIDSLCLAAVAAPMLGDRLVLHHATSPAVPPEATARTAALARDWRLRWGTELVVFDAGEFADARYRANPADRCFFCKTKLYGSIAGRLAGTGTLVLSGTNTDDLGDYRPGLRAAEEHAVRHPFVEAGISKAVLRRIAPLVGLADLAELPSAPCLSSRIETGIRIEPAALALVHAVEQLVSGTLSPLTVRCRVRRDGLVVELDEHSLSLLSGDEEASLRAGIARAAVAAGEPARPVRFAPYRTGSAFLRPEGAIGQPGPDAIRRSGSRGDVTSPPKAAVQSRVILRSGSQTDVHSGAGPAPHSALEGVRAGEQAEAIPRSGPETPVRSTPEAAVQPAPPGTRA